MSKLASVTITEFLEARIAEDEAAARSAIGAGPHWEPMTEETPDGENIYYTVEVVGVLDSAILDLRSSRADGRAQADHIARHDPARVLAECAAKRAIVKMHPVDADPCDAHDSMFKSIACDTVRALASAYKDHRGYQKEWAF